MSKQIPVEILDALAFADASWHPILIKGLEAVAEANPDYLPALVREVYLPTEGRIFAAFSIPLTAVNYVLVGEGPYPRVESATGVCFMDGAVESLWSEKGLSKKVNRATSLRNFMKMLLVADGRLALENTAGEALAHIGTDALSIGSPFIQTLTDLQANLTKQGFLLLNASLVYRPDIPPVKDAKAWQPFMSVVLSALLERSEQAHREPPQLVLWGKIAEQLRSFPFEAKFPKVVSEHPYNLSFIGNLAMQKLFGAMHLLQKQEHVAIAG